MIRQYNPFDAQLAQSELSRRSPAAGFIHLSCTQVSVYCLIDARRQPLCSYNPHHCITYLPAQFIAGNEYLSKTFLHRISQAIEMYEPFAKNNPRQNQELQKGIAIIYEGIREDG